MDGSLLIAVLALLMDFLLSLAEKDFGRHSSEKMRGSRAVPAIIIIFVVVFLGYSLIGGRNDDTLQVATKPMTEQYILGEMLKDVIEQDTSLNVEVIQGVGGGTSNIQPGMESGEFDLYPEYTGTGWSQVLKYEDLYTEDLFDKMQADYNDRYDMTWTGMYGFNDTYGLLVRTEIAEKYDLKTYTDLAKVAGELSVGANYDFYEREDGFDALCSAYGMKFGSTMDMDIGLKYQALAQDKIDVLVVFTTDGQISTADAVMLEDDKAFFTSYLCGNVIRNEVLTEHPELEGVFDKLTGIISDEEMAQMNYEVEGEGKEPADVAESFLRRKGVLK